MPTSKRQNGKGIWAQRRLQILRALDNFEGQAEKSYILEAVSGTYEFRTEGPQEQEQKLPGYYFEQALRKLMDWKFVESGAGRLTLTVDGREVLAEAEDSSQVALRERELEELQSRPLTPDVLRKIQRTLKTYERPSSITRYVKQTRGATCQLCGELGFVKRDGKRYCEVHHLLHLSKNPPPKCLAPEYLVVLCATCHRRMHYADVGEPVRAGDEWLVRVDDTEHKLMTQPRGQGRTNGPSYNRPG